MTVPDSDDVTVVTAADGSRWELVCGLEVHAELATATKMFSGAPNHFGDDPNTNVDPVTLGLPGTLPVVNQKAVELAVRFGCAVGGPQSVRRSVFSRKNYFYPDMPKNFQISQYDQPIVVAGELELPSGHVVGIERAHLEEDTGKSTHVGGAGRITGADHSLVDYNRAGVPLLEIVSRPHVRSTEQARQYVAELRSILVACGISDGKMEEGSMRVDANVSVRREGSQELRTRCEIKNLNSLRSLGRAIEHEATRQADLHAAGQKVVQETRHWDEAQGVTGTMRSKEEADDYRYFPEPDLVPVDPSPEWIAEIAAALPMLPAARRARLAEATGEPRTAESVVVVVDRAQDDQAISALAHLARLAEVGGDPSAASTLAALADDDVDGLSGPDAGARAAAAPDAAKARVLVHVTQNLAGEGGADLAPVRLAELVALEVAGELTATQAKQVLAELVADPEATAAGVAAAKGFEAMDTGALEAAVDAAIAGNPAEWEQYRTGDPKVRGKLTGFFVGQIMKATKGQADGKAATALLTQKATD
ncbi:Asp-tRNA(Asn)/Glu-tRNA(Gln) amidotransferase subunit GatB [Aquihabitans sp. G128]|uniref:Asp-tRNA(Asn)/Glu-tRNA(Gln) amidotransferase subunit GatB n=1 Tax=Aquihabitans sp. G128 TaxID=2849779 RepID=UPI001C2275C5|nr:Asp-tRNA(Asn)/Glu-tRNA(Gln) amidotransferase subunit GatB [Aquihabitans sp. G128]